MNILKIANSATTTINVHPVSSAGGTTMQQTVKIGGKPVTITMPVGSAMQSGKQITIAKQGGQIINMPGTQSVQVSTLLIFIFKKIYTMFNYLPRNK